MNILILGGTTEASELVNLLADCPDTQATLSLAGRTASPILPNNKAIKTRIGGFGGATGLADYIKKQNINALVCATHPFARNMPWGAQEAAKIAGIPVLFILRPQWKAQAGDNWTEVADHAQAIAALGAKPRCVFLTVGRLEIWAYSAAPEHLYVVRSIEEITEKPLKDATYIMARPPFTVENERAIIQEFDIEFIITKNSGGNATEAKLIAARELKIPVILIARPAHPHALHVKNASEAMAWISSL